MSDYITEPGDDLVLAAYCGPIARESEAPGLPDSASARSEDTP